MSDHQFAGSALTAREKQVLELVAGGFSSRQIAEEVGVARRTVERHIENMRLKLGARNKAHLVAKSVALGLLQFQA